MCTFIPNLTLIGLPGVKFIFDTKDSSYFSLDSVSNCASLYLLFV